MHQKSPRPQEEDADVFMTKIGLNEYDFMNDNLEAPDIHSESDEDAFERIKETENWNEALDARNKVEAGIN